MNTRCLFLALWFWVLENNYFGWNRHPQSAEEMICDGLVFVILALACLGERMAQILDQYGKPIQREVLEEPQTARVGWVTREFAEHPSRGLTPQKLHHILEDAEQGHLAAQADLFTDMEEKDGHIFAEMSKRKRALLTLDWSIEPPRNASATEKKQAAQLLEWLKDMPDWDDFLLDCLDGIGHGFSAMEIEWQRLGTDWLTKSLTHRPQRWFQTVPHDGNALRLRDGSVDGAEPWKFGWVIHKHKAKSGYLTRSGLHRVLAWPYLFKNYSVRDLAEFLRSMACHCAWASTRRCNQSREGNAAAGGG